jgi:hypothetical protein
MDTASSSHWWLGRFAARLLQLNPQASAPCAVRSAVANYHRARHLAPAEAADTFYLARETQAQSARYRAVFGPSPR